MLKQIIILVVPGLLLTSCERGLKTYHWAKEQMSFLNIKYPQQTFIREVDYDHNEVETHEVRIEESEEGALIFEGFKINYELVKQKDIDVEIFDDKYIHRFLDSLRVMQDEMLINGYHKTVYYDVHGKEHDYITHFVSESSPVEILLTAKCFRKDDYKVVEEIMQTAKIDEELLSNVAHRPNWLN